MKLPQQRLNEYRFLGQRALGGAAKGLDQHARAVGVMPRAHDVEMKARRRRRVPVTKQQRVPGPRLAQQGGNDLFFGHALSTPPTLKSAVPAAEAVNEQRSTKGMG